MTTEQKHDYPTPGSTTFRSQEWRVVRGFRLSALAVASFLVALVLFPTLDPGRLQAQELTDRQILVHLYDATDGPNWTDNSNSDLADWHGVRTNDHGRVTGLNLQGNQLLGEIRPNSATSPIYPIWNLATTGFQVRYRKGPHKPDQESAQQPAYARYRAN